MSELDYAVVRRYWRQARSSILGPYMMDGFGFPAGAGRFRFLAECRIVRKLIAGIERQGTVLDLGAGIGCWAEFFGRHFAKVVAVESSRSLAAAMRERCERHPAVEIVCADVKRYRPIGPYELVFLGGMLMYLNENDVVSLLRKLIPCLGPTGRIVCRETTVRQGSTARRGDYQAMYRSPATYARIFEACGLSLAHQELNRPYVLMQTGCEWMKSWQQSVPARWQSLSPLVGRSVYWALRLGRPWIGRFAGRRGSSFPELTNHFFVLCPRHPRRAAMRPCHAQAPTHALP